LINNISQLGSNWFCLGDYNRDPSTWANVNLPPGTHGCSHNGGTTHPSSGTNLDYGFINGAPGIDGVVLDQFIASDHYPVLCEI